MTDLMEKRLGVLRAQIDAVDVELLQLLAKRAEHVAEVGKVKHANSVEGSFIRSGREATMMRDILAAGAGQFPKTALFSIWRTIISASLKMEGGLKIVMPRTKSFHMHRLIVEYFGSCSDYILCDTVDAALAQVQGNTVGVFNVSDDWWTRDLGKHKVFAKIHDDIFALADIVPEKTGADKTLIMSEIELGDEPYLAYQNGKWLYEIDGYHTQWKGAKVLGSYA
jgi:chorismate mutase